MTLTPDHADESRWVTVDAFELVVVEPTPGDTFPGSKSRHGTQSGYRKHQSLGETPCDACRRAKAVYDQRRRSSPKHAVSNRARAAAQGRARGRLKNMHPTEYRALYLDELRKAGPS